MDYRSEPAKPSFPKAAPRRRPVSRRRRRSRFPEQVRDARLRAWLACRGGEVPAKEFAVAVFPGPGEEAEDDGVRIGDVPLESGVVEVAGEVGERGQAEAGFGDAPDDVGRDGGLRGIPVVGDGLGDAAEFDDGEFGGEPTLEGGDAATDLGDGQGQYLRRESLWMNGMDEMDKIRDWTRMAAIF